MKMKDEIINFHNEKQQINCKISHKAKTAKTGFQNTQQTGKDFKIFQEVSEELPVKDSCSEKIAIKDENKSRALRDKYVDPAKQSSSKEITFPSYVTTLHREPSVSSSSSCMSVQEQFGETDDAQVIKQNIDHFLFVLSFHYLTLQMHLVKPFLKHFLKVRKSFVDDTYFLQSN